MAFVLWLLCRRAGRRLWNERASIGYLRGYAAMVSPAFPRDVTRIFFAGEHRRNGRILVRWAMVPRGVTLFSDFSVGRASSHISWQGSQSSPAGRCVPQICVWRSDVRWITVADPSDPSDINSAM